MAFNKNLIFLSFHLCIILYSTFAQNLQHFTYNGFQKPDLQLDGSAKINQNGLLQLTNTSFQLTAHAFYPNPLHFNSSASFSFSTTFAFAMYPAIEAISGHGIVFFLSPSKDFHTATAGKFFGLLNSSIIGNTSNHLFAVEFDTIQDYELNDIDSNHVGIDVDSLVSNVSATAGYFSDSEGINKNVSLLSAKPFQVWVDYDDRSTEVTVTMAPLGLPRPSKPLLLTTRVNLTQVMQSRMYVGFASSTGAVASTHYVLGWSFRQGRTGIIPALDLSKLPSLPKLRKRKQILGVASIIVLVIVLIVLIIVGVVLYMRWKKKYEEIYDDWEKEYRVQRVSYKDLYRATKGFKETGLLGAGGFGKVYKGTLPSTKIEVAVKKVSHGSSQGMKEFVAEIGCLGRLRHRNLVKLVGYCRRQGELLLVYEYMPNGSLDTYLYNEGKPNLGWFDRFRIIRGVASALVYLHEEWEQVIVHRDVKSSNVLLDASMNARLGDFGLARLYDHGTNPQTTHVVGTVGYLAPELSRKGKASTMTDVFSFGMFILEVTSGRSPTSLQSEGRKYLVDWVYDCWKRGVISEAIDPRLEGDNVLEEIELVLKLGLICTHPKPESRPTMRQVTQILDGDVTLPGTSLYNDRMLQSTYDDQSLPLFPSSSKGRSSYYTSQSVLVVGR